jgi:hypothetical protein
MQQSRKLREAAYKVDERSMEVVVSGSGKKNSLKSECRFVENLIELYNSIREDADLDNCDNH